MSNDKPKGIYLIELGTYSVAVFELAHPLLVKPIDVWDIIATVITGFVSYFIYNGLFKNQHLSKKTSIPN